MADKRSTVELVFQGVDRTGEATKAALANAERFSQSVGNVTAPVADFTKKAVAMEAALLAAGAAITVFSIKAAGDFDEAFREISTLIDEPIEALGDFRQAILDYSSTSTQSLDQVTGAVYSAISAGVDYTDSLDAVSAAEQLAIAGKADLQDSLVVLVSSLNAYGESMDSAGSFADALFTTVKQGQTTLPELAAGLSQVTGLAANAGIEFDELLAAVAGITATGAPTSQAISGIRAAISNIIKPTAEAEELAQKLGIQFNAAALESKGFSGVLDDVKNATGGSTEQMAQLFGSVEGLNVVLGLSGEGAEAFSRSLEAMENKSGAVGAAFGKMADSIGNSNQKIKNAILDVLIAIGTPLLDEYGGIAEGIAAVFNSIGASVREGELGDLVSYIEEVMGDAVEALATVAANLPEVLNSADLSGFRQGVEAVIESIQELFDGFELGTVDGLAQAISSLGAVFQGLSEFTASVIDSLGWLFDTLANNQEEISELVKNWAGFAGLVGGFGVQADVAARAVGSLAGILGDLGVILFLSGGGGVAGAARRAASGFATLAGALGKGSAVGGAAIYFGVQAGRLISALEQWYAAAMRAAEAERELADATDRRNQKLAELEEQTGVSIDAQGDVIAQIEEAGLALDENTGKWVKATEAVIDYSEVVNEKMREAGLATEAEREQLNRIEQAFVDAGLAAQLTGEQSADAFDGAGNSARKAGEDAADFIRTVGEDGVVTFERIGTRGSKAFADVKGEIEEVKQTSEEFRLGLREIASEEFIATINADVELNVAKLEAETKRVEAAFESINTTIQSTGDLIASLFGSDAPDWDRFGFETGRQIRLENERRDEALRLQKELTEAQVAALRERAKAMQNGQALIEVDGSGLQPHLEAIMFEILRTLQTRVNEDGLDMLLGSTT